MHRAVALLLIVAMAAAGVLAVPAFGVAGTIIQGRVIDQETRRGVSQKETGLHIILVKIDGEFEETFARTNCEHNEGCADRNGRFRFTRNFIEGRQLPAGHYRLELYAELFYYDATLEVDYRGGTKDVGEIELRPIAVEIEFVSTPRRDNPPVELDVQNCPEDLWPSPARPDICAGHGAGHERIL